MSPPKEDWERSAYDPSKPDDQVKGTHTPNHVHLFAALDEKDIALLKMYGQGPYAAEAKAVERSIQETLKHIDEKIGVKEADTGLAPPSQWDIPADKRRVQEEQTLQVARCTKIIDKGPVEERQYVINVKQIGKFVVGLGKKVNAEDVEEGMRVGCHQLSILPISCLSFHDRVDATGTNTRCSYRCLQRSTRR